MTSVEKRLRTLIPKLNPADRKTLLAFAEFLLSRSPVYREILEANVQPRPPQESVVGAIKRLSASYPMLDKGKMLNKTSSLMAQHVMNGRDKNKVIDELENVFQQHYDELVQSEKDASERHNDEKERG
ncbi:MAG: Crp/Fnr family transcriptional regulator [Gammaproteobacteria bacterium]|nr:Crp/Fnr family transcriptional regulator [Gammaproteobacteria bacterium]